MLVKFLSFSASVWGTARYKAIFLSCLALVISLAGITAVALQQDAANPKGAASTVEQDGSGNGQDDSAPQLGGIRKQAAKEEQSTSAQPTAPQQSGGNPTAQPAENTPKPTQAVVTITLSKSEFELLPGTTSDLITSSVSDGSTLSWSVTPETDQGVQVVADETNPSAFAFRIKADATATAKSYTFTITAKDAARNINLQKTLTVVVR